MGRIKVGEVGGTGRVCRQVLGKGGDRMAAWSARWRRWVCLRQTASWPHRSSPESLRPGSMNVMSGATGERSADRRPTRPDGQSLRRRDAAAASTRSRDRPVRAGPLRRGESATHAT